MKLAPFCHETGAEHRKNFADIGQGFLAQEPQHEGVADAHHLDLLSRIDEPQHFGDTHGHGIAAFEDSGQHGFSPASSKDIQDIPDVQEVGGDE